MHGCTCVFLCVTVSMCGVFCCHRRVARSLAPAIGHHLIAQKRAAAAIIIQTRYIVQKSIVSIKTLGKYMRRFLPNHMYIHVYINVPLYVCIYLFFIPHKNKYHGECCYRLQLCPFIFLFGEIYRKLFHKFSLIIHTGIDIPQLFKVAFLVDRANLRPNNANLRWRFAFKSLPVCI